MMKSYACILLVSLAVTGIYADEPEKLVGGTDVVITKHPYIVSIRLRGEHKCGGAILDSYHIITAAHCVEPYMKKFDIMKDITIVTGTSSLKFGGQIHAVAAMDYHPMYIATPGYNWGGYDVGIFKVAKPINFSVRTQPIGLPTSDIPDDVEVTVAGWGATSSGRLSDNLQDITVYTMGPKECRETMGRVHDFEFCTLYGPGRGTCKGDSGSPVIHEGKIVGVVSNGIPCAVGYPDVHTNLFKVRDWINEILAQ